MSNQLEFIRLPGLANLCPRPACAPWALLLPLITTSKWSNLTVISNHHNPFPQNGKREISVLLQPHPLCIIASFPVASTHSPSWKLQPLALNSRKRGEWEELILLVECNCWSLKNMISVFSRSPIVVKDLQLQSQKNHGNGDSTWLQKEALILKFPICLSPFWIFTTYVKTEEK